MAEIRLINKGEEGEASFVEKTCLETPWSKSQIENLPENCIYAVAISNQKVVGIASMYLVFGEGQVMNIAVLPEYRKNRLGEGLMTYLVNAAVAQDCETMVLEVAENNLPAISLYKKFGFEAFGKRKGFYHGTDALVMAKSI